MPAVTIDDAEMKKFLIFGQFDNLFSILLENIVAKKNIAKSLIQAKALSSILIKGNFFFLF